MKNIPLPCTPAPLPGHARKAHVDKLSSRVSLVLVALLSISTVRAANMTVRNTNDSGAGSLRQAIVDSVDGGTINFSVIGVP